MIRESSWRISWNPLAAGGASPRLLLHYGDLMEGETARALEQMVDTGSFDFAPSGQVAARGNVKQRLEFSRRDVHATGEQSWDACQNALMADPWGVKSLIQVVPRGGTPRLYTSAILSSTHQPATDGPTPESVHQYAFRIAPQWMMTVGIGITVLGGFYNTPNTIIISIPEDSGIVPGDTVLVEGVDGVPDGYYPVIGGGGGSVSLGAASNPAAADVYDGGDITGGSSSGTVTMHYPGSQLLVTGLTDGAAYSVSVNGGAPVSLGAIIGSSKQINLGDLTSTNSYERWWGSGFFSGAPIAELDPLPIDGEDRPNGTPPYVCDQTRSASITLKLFRNGVEYSATSFTPHWTARKHYSAGGPANHDLTAGSLGLNLSGPGGQTSPPLGQGFPGSTPGGTITKVEPTEVEP